MACTVAVTIMASISVDTINRVLAMDLIIKHINIIIKPTNAPTQGHPNPRQNRLKVAFGPFFATANNVSWVGIGFS